MASATTARSSCAAASSRAPERPRPPSDVRRCGSRDDAGQGASFGAAARPVNASTADASTWSIPSVSGFMNMVQGKKTPRLKMKKLSAPALLAKWELGPSTVNMLVRGMALHAGALKELSALALVRKLKAYKDSYKTFPHMTSPYVYPREGLGAALPKVSVPARRDAYSVVAHVPALGSAMSAMGGSISVFAYINHMHQIGKKIWLTAKDEEQEASEELE